MSNNYAHSFKRIDFVVIPSYIELPWFWGRKDDVEIAKDGIDSAGI